MIRAVLVDDEPPARRKLRHLLAAEQDMEVVGEAGSGAEGVELLNRLQPEVVFLDIQLPDCTGFDVIDALESRERLHLVFVTAYDDFALRAFDVHAIDYLLKPVEPNRFTQTLKRVRRVIATPDSGRIASKLEDLMRTLRTDPGHIRRLLIQENDRSIFIDVSRIEWMEAARNYVCVHSGESTYVIRSTLEAVAAKMDGNTFRRISRSEVININHISEVRTWFHGDQKVILKSGKELIWSRRYRSATLEDLERV